MANHQPTADLQLQGFARAPTEKIRRPGMTDRRKWTTARIDQLTRDQVWPPQTSPPNAQPSTRSVSPLLSEMLAE